MIPYLIAKSSDSIEVTSIAWWIVLMTRLLWVWICAIEVATWFFMLASNTMIAVLESKNALNMILSSFQICAFLLSLFLLFMEWNDIQLAKMLISLLPEENSLLNESKEGKTLFNLLFVSTIGPLRSKHYLGISISSDNWWEEESFVCLDFKNNLTM